MTIPNPILQYALLAAGLAASLFLFLSLKRELHLSMRRQQERFDEIAERLREAEEPMAITVEAPRPAHAGFYLNKRALAMRLLRRGEDVSHIAAALGVPRAEVELLIRVQRMSAAAAGMAGHEENGGGNSAALTAQDAR